jgi:hypothetical protein
MFGLVISGRPVLTNTVTPSPGKYVFQIPSTPPFSSLAIFLLPGATLPSDQAAAIYVQVPPSQEFGLVGAIANEKPSAIIRVRNSSGSAGQVNGVGGIGDVDEMVDDDATAAVPAGDVVVGLSIEPAAQVAAQLEALKSTSMSSTGAATSSMAMTLARPPSRVSTKLLAQRIIENAFNYLGSFEGPDGNVPMKSFQEWWKKFENRVDMDPSFLERAEAR